MINRDIKCKWRVVNVRLPCPCHVVAPAILQSLIVPLCSPCGCCVVLAVSKCNTAKCSFSAVCPPWEAFDQLRCCVCFRVSLLACSAPWLSGVLSELKPGFLQRVFSRIRRRVHDMAHALIFVFITHATKLHFSSIPEVVQNWVAILLRFRTISQTIQWIKLFVVISEIKLEIQWWW